MKFLEWTPELAKSFWNDLGGSDFLANIAFSRHAAQYLVELCEQYLNEESVALDFGSGFNAYLARELLKKGTFVKIYEPSIDETKLPHEIRKNQKFLGADQTVASNGYDIIFAVEVLEHLFENDLRPVLTKLYAALKTNAVLVVTSPSQEDLVLASRYCPVCRHLFHPWGHLRSFDKDSMQKLLESSGFTCETILNVDFSSTRDSIEELKRVKRILISQAEEADLLLRNSNFSEKARRLMLSRGARGLLEKIAEWKNIVNRAELCENPNERQIGAGGTLVAFARKI